MSSSEPAGTLTARAPGARIEVLDAWLRPVAGGDGEIEVALPPGAYRVNARVGADQDHRLVVVRPGLGATVHLDVRFGASAPVPGTVTENEAHGHLADTLTGADTALVVILRGLRGQQMAPLDVRLDVLDRRGARVALPEPVPAASVPPEDPRAIGWSVPVPAGGYRLRWSTSNAQTMEQSVWVSRGRQTVLFVPQGPHGPVPSLGSVHLVPGGRRWDAHDSAAHAIESTLAAFEAPAAGPADARRWDELRHADPMLVLLSTHLLLREQPGDVPDPRLVAAARRLLDALGPHSDVLALARHVGVPLPPGADRGWPPMLTASLDLLLAPAPRGRGVGVPPGSLVEAVSGQRHAGGPLLLWDPTGLDDGIASAAPPPIAAPAAAPPPARSAPAVAVARVRDLLVGVGHRLDAPPAAVATRIGSAEIGRRLGMARGLVEACVAEIVRTEP